jgi:hypothetical protein
MKQLPVTGNSCTTPKGVPQSNSLILQEIIKEGFGLYYAVISKGPSCCCGFKSARVPCRGSKMDAKRQAPHRRWERLPVFLPVLAQLNDDRGNGFQDVVIVLNISQGGLLIAGFQPPHRLSELTIEVSTAPLVRDLGGRKGVDRIRARVVRSELCDDYSLYALEFPCPLATTLNDIQHQAKHILPHSCDGVPRPRD